MAQPPRYRIHPAIGIARVGNAGADDHFIGPELPNQPGGGAGGGAARFKSGGAVRRQAARFRIFEYVESKGRYTVSREITAAMPEVIDLEWKVHLANRKASFFEFDGLAGSPLLPVQPAHVRRNAAIANRKSLEIDPLARKIAKKSVKGVEFRKGTSGNPASERWPTPAPVPAIDSLGELRTDPDGRLIVIGGAGIAARRAGAGPIADYSNNDGWFDDTSDGPVTATLRLRVNGKPKTVPVQGAWVLVGPPDFAPDVRPMVTLWDLLVDMAVRALPLPADETVYQTGELKRLHDMAAELGGGRTAFTSYQPSFDDDVAPILRQALHARSVFAPAQSAHVTLGGSSPAPLWKLLSDPAESNALRQSILARVRKPETPGLGADDMPRLLGDDPYDKYKTKRWGLSVTVTQYAILSRWAAGKFVASTLGPASLLSPPVPASITPAGLDRAALEAASGGAFFPGIEVGWQIREPALFAEPFRIRHGAPSRYIGDGAVTVAPGHFSRQMALPWLADFLQCQAEQQMVTNDPWGWWPSQRPDGVYKTGLEAASGGTMVPWVRATVGASSDWPPDPGGPTPRPAQMPSYDQMIANWPKFAFVDGAAGIYAEIARAAAIP